MPDGALRPLLEALTSPDPDLRPPTAAAALERLHRLDVPDDGPWPEVPDRLGEPPGTPAAHRWADVVIVASLIVIALCVVANALILL